jgi:hypothetical protein
MDELTEEVSSSNNYQIRTTILRLTACYSVRDNTYTGREASMCSGCYSDLVSVVDETHPLRQQLDTLAPRRGAVPHRRFALPKAAPRPSPEPRRLQLPPRAATACCMRHRHRFPPGRTTVPLLRSATPPPHSPAHDHQPSEETEQEREMR